MGLLDKIKDVMGMPQDEVGEYDESGAYYDREGTYWDYGQTSHGTNDRQRYSSNYSDKGKVTTLPYDLNDVRVVIHSPSKYDDARMVCDKLKALNSVVVKLEKLDRDEAQRVVDFIMGACYTMDGHVEEIREDVFLIAPSMVNIEKEFDIDRERDSKTSSLFAKFSVR